MTGRREAAEMLQVTLYTKPGCHLCDDLLAELHEWQSGLSFTVAERNIDADPADFERFRHLIPVLDVPGAGLLYPPHDLSAVRDAIASAVHTVNEKPWASCHE